MNHKNLFESFIIIEKEQIENLDKDNLNEYLEENEEINGFIKIEESYIKKNNRILNCKEILELMNSKNLLIYEQNRNVIINSLIINGTNKS